MQVYETCILSVDERNTGIEPASQAWEAYCLNLLLGRYTLRKLRVVCIRFAANFLHYPHFVRTSIISSRLPAAFEKSKVTPSFSALRLYSVAMHSMRFCA